MESTVRKYKYIKTQSDAVLHFLQTMDIEMLDAVLVSIIDMIEDFSDKDYFIKRLRLVFNEFIQSGDTFLQRYPGKCNSDTCTFRRSTGFTFVGNHSGNYIDLVMCIFKGEVLTIHECTSFKCSNENILKNRCIEIDERGEIDDDVLPF